MLKNFGTILIVIICFFLSGPLFAGGSKESKGQKVNGLENWDYSYDIKDKKPGKYNLIIEAKDKAGNVTVAGPFNVWVDPNSDIPVVSVNNPVANMRVGTNLNIVGTCVDDVAVDHVEVQLDNGEAVKAIGTEYWSYYLSVKDIPDGMHKLTVRGFDNNGTPSKPVVVSFNLDKFRPENAVTSHENGFLASGIIKLKGTATDANGIAKVWISADGGKVFKENNFSATKDPSTVTFEYEIDTKKFADGPQVFWIRSMDKTGSIGISAFLLFVDNTKPSIQILRPLASEPVNGIVGVAGMIRDVIGIKEAGWSVAGKTGTIALVPGNPYFSQSIDLSAIKDKTALITFFAVDTIGNRSELKYPVTLDHDADLPVLELLDLKDKAITGPDLAIGAHVRDDDGVKAVHYSVDGKADQSQPMAESGIIRISGLTVGAHKLAFQAEDSLGTLGKKVELSITVKGGVPVVRFDAVKPGASPTGYVPDPSIGQAGPVAGTSDGLPFINGIRLFQDGNNQVTGSIALTNPIKTAEYTIDGKTWQALTLKQGADPLSKTFEINLPKDIHFGMLPLEVRVKDTAEQETHTSGFLMVLDYRSQNAGISVVFHDERIVNNDPITLSPDHPLVGRFVGAQAVSVRIQPPTNLISAELSGSTVIVKPLRDGLSQPVKIIVTSAQKHDFSSPEFVFRTDTTAPEIKIISPESGTRVKDKISVNVSVADAGGPADADYSLDGGQNWQKLNLAVTPSGTNIKQTVTTDSISDGPLPLIVRVRDKAGNETRSAVMLVKDQTPPIINLQVPAFLSVGSNPVWGNVSDIDQIAKLEYRQGSGNWVSLATAGGYFAFTIDASDSQTQAIDISVRAIDRTGNETVVVKTLAANANPASSDLTADAGKKPSNPKPKIVLINPPDSAILTVGQPLIIALSDWSPTYSRLTWALEGKKNPVTVEIPQSGLLLLSPDFTDVKAGQGGINFQLQGDSKQSESLNLKFKFDPKANAPTVSLPWVESSNREVGLYARDEVGIKEIHYTIDAKNEVTLDSGDARVLGMDSLAPGKHQLSVWAVNTNGISSLKTDKVLQIAADTPSVKIEQVGSPGAEQPFVDGMDLVLEKGTRLVFDLSQAMNLKDLSYTVNGGTSQKLTIKTNAVDAKGEIALPATLPWGFNLITISGSDNAGIPFSRQSFFYRLAPANSGGSPTEVAENSFVFDPSALDQSGNIQIQPDKGLQAYFTGRTIAKVALEPATANFQAEFSGQQISVKGLKAATDGQRHIVVTDIDGDTWRSPEITLTYSAQGPILSVTGPDEGSWVLDKLNLKGTIVQDIGTPTLEYAIGDSAFTALSVTAHSGSPGNFDFASAIDVSSFPDGPIILNLRANDQSGNSRLMKMAFSKDSTPPVISIIAPPEHETVNGLTTIVGIVRDAGRVKSIEFSSDYRTWVPLEFTDVFKMDLDFSKFAPPYQFWFRATDLAGNTASLNPVFQIDQESDKPVVKIQTPTENEVIRNDFKVSGIAYDDDGIQNLYYRLDYKESNTSANSKSGASSGSPSSPTPATPEERSVFGPLVFGFSDAITSPEMARKAAKNPINHTARQAAITSANLRSQLGTFTKLEGKNSFTIPLGMLATGDNEHTIQVVAEDIYGTLGDVVSRTFRISTAEPTSQILTPTTGSTVRGTIKMTGTAADNNGIASVWLSFDNGTSFVAANGTENWSYDLDTTTLRDGTHVVVIKTIDKYDSEGLYTTQIAVDNTLPTLNLDSPADGAEMTGVLRLSGRISDNIGLAGLHLVMVPADAPVGTSKASLDLDLDVKTVLQQEIDISKLSPGWYTMRIEARDHADNRNWISRDIKIVDQLQDDSLEILYPLEGELVHGNFTLSGKLDSSHLLPETVSLLVNGQVIGDFPVGRNGYFNIPLGTEQSTPGPLTITVKALLGPESKRILRESLPRQITFDTNGYWVRFEQVQTGDFLTKRPFIKGTAGYFLPPVPKESPEFPAYRKELERHSLDRVQISLDHGITWITINGTDKWQYRVETQNYPDGDLFLLMRVLGKDGGMAVARAIMIIDKTPPLVTVLKPSEEGRFNGKIDVVGTASDNSSLDDITIDLRQGDKADYKVPSFIQGLYLDGHFLGASTWEAGIGLTFFDDNVKLQADFGQAPVGDRFDGFVLGAKLIANIANIPFSYLFGPDWDFFSMAFAVGAQFDYFTMSGAELNFNQPGVVLGSAILQWEFAKFHFTGISVFRNISLYTEEQLWFISSDVQAGIAFKTTFGLRVSIF